MFVPTAAKKSHRVPDQALTFGGRKTAEVRLLRFWDFGVPVLGRASHNRFRMEVAATLPRLCRRAGSPAPMNLRGPRQFDGSAADQSQSLRALW